MVSDPCNIWDILTLKIYLLFIYNSYISDNLMLVTKRPYELEFFGPLVTETQLILA